MSETAEVMADAFEAEANVAPVVNVSGVDAPTVASGLEKETTTTQKFYTEEDLARVRSQEKDKVYPQLEKLKEEVLALKKEKEEEAARKAADAQAKDAEQKAKFENDLDAKELLKLKEQEWQEQLARERQERETAFALLEREKTFADLQAYRQQLIEQERESIIPDLLDLIQGNTREEIQASVEGLKSRSERILESAQSAMQNARKEMRGASTNAPTAGPLETNMESRQFTAQDIASMSVNEYAKYRDKLLSDSARGRSQGFLG
jgi:hypothetical protein